MKMLSDKANTMIKKNALKKHPKILVSNIEEQIASIRIKIAKSQKSPIINFKSIYD